jgi:cystathionine beta-synthase
MLTDIKKMKFKENILETIGNTPLVRLNKMAKPYKPHIFVKVESFNPGGSVKDRIGVEIIEEAERTGELKPGGTIVESTSGNTGMGLAIAAAIKGYKTVFTMPDKMSGEKIKLLRAFGAEVIVTPTAVPHESPESYTEVAKQVVRETPNSILANQYFNPKNNESHYHTTGPEIWDQTGGQIDYFVCAIGTGGTISGAGKFLKEKNPNVKVVGIDPKGSILREYFYTKKFSPVFKTYKVEGIGQDYIPGTLHFEYIDEVIEVTDKESFLAARKLTREEGIFAGGSCGSAIAGAFKLAERLTEKDVVVVLLPDSGSKYLSKIYDDDWMRENGFLTPERITLRYVLQAKSTKLPQLVTINTSATIRSALELMTGKNISQLPVFDGDRCVGSVSEGILLTTLLKDSSKFDALVQSIMEPPFQEVHMNEEITKAVEHFAKKEQAVLVKDDTKLAGIITRFDVLEYLSR